MKNILQALILFLLVCFSTNSHSQVILNGGSFEAMFIEDQVYTVPVGKILIVTHVSSVFYTQIEEHWVIWPKQNTSSTSYDNSCAGLLHIPLPAGTFLLTNSGFIAGYLIDVDEWGATSDVPDDEIIDNGGGGIEIYPNPTDDLASVFVDYQGDWKMTVYDINGQIVLETQSETPVKSIDTNALSAGTYIVSVRAKRKLIGSSQLIVQ